MLYIESEGDISMFDICCVWNYFCFQCKDNCIKSLWNKFTNFQRQAFLQIHVGGFTQDWDKTWLEPIIIHIQGRIAEKCIWPCVASRATETTECTSEVTTEVTGEVTWFQHYSRFQDSTGPAGLFVERLGCQIYPFTCIPECSYWWHFICAMIVFFLYVIHWDYSAPYWMWNSQKQLLSTFCS